MELSSRLPAPMLLIALSLLAAPFAAPLAHADDERRSRDGRGGDRNELVVSCGSTRGALNYCRADLRGLRLLDLQQQSRSDCIRGETFGFDPGGVWVRGGCRAHFWFVPGRDRSRGRYRDDGGYRDWGQTFVCASIDHRRNLCAVPGRARVELRRQISHSACIRGHSWGQERGAVWVDKGCRAEFGLRDGRG
jgi:hypothetical protein